MNRYRNAPGVRGPSHATASTLCQKCLKRDIYECKVSAQERPYAARPSRTQQLANPKLKPQLSTDVPNDLLRSKGVADDLLAKREEERGRKRDLDEIEPLDGPGQTSKRARSVSSHSTNSVSTISTSRSHSRSPSRGGHDRTSESRHSRSRKRRYSDSSSGYTGSSYSSKEKARSPSRDWPDDRNTRRRRRESSPEHRGRARIVSRDGRRDRTRSRSVDQSRIARERRSVTPEKKAGCSHPTGTSRDNMDRADYSHGRSSRAPAGRSGRGQDHAPPAPQPRRERSLSPYSKRIALTQTMNSR